jgi:hypothetical protein
MNIQLVRENLEYRKSARYAPLSSLPTAVELGGSAHAQRKDFSSAVSAIVKRVSDTKTFVFSTVLYLN